MKAQYGFSQAEHGKFYRPDAVFHFPVYLEPDVEEFIRQIADERNVDMQTLINEWLRASIKIIQSIPPASKTMADAVQA
jgi:hypothetical protein